MAAEPQVNGVSPTSAFLDHLLHYPVVSDGVATVKETKYGKQTLALSSSAYEKLAKPVLPYLVKPYGYVQPYVAKADEVGDRSLKTLDERFPVVLKPTAEVYQETKDLVLFPVRKGLESRDHVLSVFAGERKQVQGEGVVPLSKAAVSTAFIVSNEALALARKYLEAAKQHQATAATLAKTPAEAPAASTPTEKPANGN